MNFKAKLTEILTRIENSGLARDEKDEAIASILASLKSAVLPLVYLYIRGNDKKRIMDNINTNPSEFAKLLTDTVTDPKTLEKIDFDLISMLEAAENELAKSGI